MRERVCRYRISVLALRARCPHEACGVSHAASGAAPSLHLDSPARVAQRLPAEGFPARDHACAARRITQRASERLGRRCSHRRLTATERSDDRSRTTERPPHSQAGNSQSRHPACRRRAGARPRHLPELRPTAEIAGTRRRSSGAIALGTVSTATKQGPRRERQLFDFVGRPPAWSNGGFARPWAYADVRSQPIDRASSRLARRFEDLPPEVVADPESGFGRELVQQWTNCSDVPLALLPTVLATLRVCRVGSKRGSAAPSDPPLDERAARDSRDVCNAKFLTQCNGERLTHLQHSCGYGNRRSGAPSRSAERLARARSSGRSGREAAPRCGGELPAPGRSSRAARGLRSPTSNHPSNG